jgi:hypothetical protein
MTIFNWQFNNVFDPTNSNEALDWEPQFSQDIDVDQVLLDEDIRTFNMVLPPLRNHQKPHTWVHQLNSSRPSMVTLDDPDGELN